MPEADQTSALEVTARFVDAWYAGGSYAGGSHQAWRDQLTRWAGPTLARQLPSTYPSTLPGSRRIAEPAIRAE